MSLTSVMDFCRSPCPMRTSCLTFGHLAASDRTEAIDVFDHPLMPKPSWMPSTIGFVPQNDVSSVFPEFAMIWSALCASPAWTLCPTPTTPLMTAAANAARVEWLIFDVAFLMFYPPEFTSDAD